LIDTIEFKSITIVFYHQVKILIRCRHDSNSDPYLRTRNFTNWTNYFMSCLI